MGTMHSINKACTTIETAFNVTGSLPAVSYVNTFRVLLGKIQFVSGALTAIGATLAQAIESHKRAPNPATLAKMERLQKFGMQHVIHGGLNVLRGCAEVALAVTTFGIGNMVVFLPYNLLRNPAFSPHHGYRPMHAPLACRNAL